MKLIDELKCRNTYKYDSQQMESLQYKIYNALYYEYTNKYVSNFMCDFSESYLSYCHCENGFIDTFNIILYPNTFKNDSFKVVGLHNYTITYVYDKKNKPTYVSNYICIDSRLNDDNYDDEFHLNINIINDDKFEVSVCDNYYNVLFGKLEISSMFDKCTDFSLILSLSNTLGRYSDIFSLEQILNLAGQFREINKNNIFLEIDMFYCKYKNINSVLDDIRRDLKILSVLEI